MGLTARGLKDSMQPPDNYISPASLLLDTVCNMAVARHSPFCARDMDGKQVGPSDACLDGLGRL